MRALPEPPGRHAALELRAGLPIFATRLLMFTALRRVLSRPLSVAPHQATSSALDPAVTLARALPHRVAELISEPETLLRNCCPHRWARRDLVDKPPQPVAGQEPIDNPVEQIAVKERVDQLRHAFAPDHLRDDRLQLSAREKPF